MTYFKFRTTETITIEAIKKQYHKLAMQWHPDRPNGDLATMQAINAEFDSLRKRYYNVHEGVNGATYTDETQTTMDDVTKDFIDIISQLVNMEGLEVEICGKWLWVGGNTREHKDDLKGMGMRWAPKKRRWYKAPKDWKRKAHRELSMDEIRSHFGSETIQTKQRLSLQA